MAVLLLCGQAGASALPETPRIVVDEYGNGFWQPIPDYRFLPFSGALGPDPTGGVPEQPVLIYNLPIGAVIAGDVLMRDLAEGGAVLDVIRFTGQGQLIFYSDNVNGFDEPADTPHPPYPYVQNYANAEEIGVEGFNWADYTPLPGQPGWNDFSPSYKFISDGLAPEPATLSLLAVGGLALLRRRRS